MGLLPDTWNCGLRMRRECRERFPLHQLQRKPLVSNPGMHHGTCVTHVPWCMSGSLTCGCRGKRSRHSRRMRNPQFYVSGKRPMALSAVMTEMQDRSNSVANASHIMHSGRSYWESVGICDEIDRVISERMAYYSGFFPLDIHLRWNHKKNRGVWRSAL